VACTLGHVCTTPYSRPGARNAHVIAADGATCLVLRPRQPTLFQARGEGALPVSYGLSPAGPAADDEGIAIRVDVGDFLHAKLQALTACRSQFPMQPDHLPASIFHDLFGVEYFLPAPSLAEVDPSEVTGVPHADAALAAATVPHSPSVPVLGQTG
jgi:hypothetical protein